MSRLLSLLTLLLLLFAAQPASGVVRVSEENRALGFFAEGATRAWEMPPSDQYRTRGAAGWSYEFASDVCEGPNLYGYVMNRPTGATDPLGLEIFLPFNPNALGGIGHPAILAGNSETGYQFRSFSAGEKRGWFVGAEKDNLESKSFPTLDLAMKFLKEQGFKEFAMWNSSREQEQKAIEAIDKAYSSAAYNLGTADRTCAGMARTGIKASGVMKISPDDSFSMHPTRFFALYSMFASKTGTIK